MSRWIAGLMFCLTVLPHAITCGLEPLPSYSDVVSLRQDATLRSVAFADEEIGVACGDRGAILRTFNGGVSWQPIDSRVECQLDKVVWVDQQRVVIVGGSYDKVTQLSRSVVLYSNDSGKRWQRADDQELPRFVTLTLETDGSLIADCEWSHSLLTTRLVSHDAGRTWNDASVSAPSSGSKQPRRSSPTVAEMIQWAKATQLPVAIRDACRIRDTTFCAVGDHGVILISEDQGQSWNPVQGQQRQTSVLFVANTAESVAWSMVGSEALESRNRVSLLLDQSSEGATSNELEFAIANQVAIMLGGAGADQFTATNEDLHATASNWITIHQPTCLVLDETLPATTHDAFFRAATSLGVRRVAVYGFNGRGNTALHRDALLPKCGVLASDLQADALHYLCPHRNLRSSTSVRYPYDIAPTNHRGTSVTSGLRQQEGQQLASVSATVSRHQLQIVQARLRQTKRIETIIATSDHAAEFSESIDKTLEQTAKTDQFRVAWSILQATRPDHLVGSAAFHEVALDQVASRFPNTSAGRWAALRREAIRHSLEWQRLRSSLTESLAQTRSAPVAEAVAVSPFQVEASDVQQVSGTSPLVVPKPETHHVSNVKQTEDVPVEVDLPWEFHPLVLVAREAARRRSDDGNLQVAGGESANLKRLAETTVSKWSSLLRDDGATLLARRADMPPKLDGVLSDGCWQSALPSAGVSPRVRVAYDEDYVYIAMECSPSEFQTDPQSSDSSVTNRDHDLSQVDRLQLAIDTDRDLMTSMQLQVSASGRTRDAIDGNPNWQPTWYRDTQRTGESVTVEIAILRRDLVELPIPAGDVWFL
ncbi:MAG: YCF48-related protein, partial [Rubripirellula sp.]